MTNNKEQDTNTLGNSEDSSGAPRDMQSVATGMIYRARISEECIETKEPKHPTLWRYLNTAHENGISFHIVGVNRMPDGGFHFYIHPQSVSGDTQDYLIWPDPFSWNDMIVNRLDSPPPDIERFKKFLASQFPGKKEAV